MYQKGNFKEFETKKSETMVLRYIPFQSSQNESKGRLLAKLMLR